MSQRTKKDRLAEINQADEIPQWNEEQDANIKCG